MKALNDPRSRVTDTAKIEGLNFDFIMGVVVSSVLEATQAGESEAVAYLSENSAQLLANGSNYVLCYSKAAANSFERRGYSIKPLYTAPPSFAALQADNERLREYYLAQEEMRRIGMMNASDELYERVEKARAALAGQEKKE